ncbi:hypothetical protein Q3G72_030523 [Acer saccharum]|nr:hypothetical protein Q3G72_030523 [Acer saccharum]
MTDPQTPENLPSSSSSSSSSSKSAPERSTKYSSQKKLHYPNPPDSTNPDPATLREQWRFAIRQYSRWAPILSLPSSLLLLLPLRLMIIQQQNPSPLIDALPLLQSLLMDLWLDATTVRKMHHCPHCSRSLTTDGYLRVLRVPSGLVLPYFVKPFSKPTMRNDALASCSSLSDVNAFH